MDCYFIYGNNNNNSYKNYYMSDNYKNEMQELEKKKKKKYGKKQSCGSRAVKLSTDPQSVAARERRHRISEKFKILQSLVPGGSKLDTVSMLEEAIVYVKYLKTQLWWLIHQQQHQNININHLVMDEHEATSSMFNDHIPPINCDHSYLSTDQNQVIISDHGDYCSNTYKDDDDNNGGEYDQQVLGFQDSNWFQNVEGQQQTLNVDDIDPHVYYGSW